MNEQQKECLVSHHQRALVSVMTEMAIVHSLKTLLVTIFVRNLSKSL